VLFGLAWSGAASAAEPPASNDAGAAFDEGLAQMKAGRYEAACPALEKSYRLEPLPGVLFTLAECESAWGKLATALGHYQQFLDLLTTLAPAQRDKHTERRGVAAEKISALGGLVPELTIRVPDTAPGGLVVKRNGTLVEPATYGISRGVDPGDYTIVAELEGKKVYERKLKLAERDRASIDVTLTSATTAGSSGEAEATGGESDGSGLATAGYVLVGVGAASLVAGLVTGGLAWGKKGTIDDNCIDRLCTPEGRDAVDSGQRLALVSTITVVVGLVGLAGGTTLLLLGGDDSNSEGAAAAPATGSVELLVSGTAETALFGLTGRF
jgi:hypothetical protein